MSDPRKKFMLPQPDSKPSAPDLAIAARLRDPTPSRGVLSLQAREVERLVRLVRGGASFEDAEATLAERIHPTAWEHWRADIERAATESGPTEPLPKVKRPPESVDEGKALDDWLRSLHKSSGIAVHRSLGRGRR
jgi:hypothetical protein